MLHDPPVPNVENEAPVKNTWKRLETAYNDLQTLGNGIYTCASFAKKSDSTV